MGIVYCTREDVKSSAGSASTARDDARVDRACESAARSVDALTGRRFWPRLTSVTFDAPVGKRLWLETDLISATTITANGTTVSSSAYDLEPATEGPPYRRVEFDSAPSGDVVVTGLFGFTDDAVTAGALAEALDASETEVDVTNAAAVGVGSLIKVDSERMVVTGKAMLTTGQTTGGALAAAQSDVSVAVSSGTAFAVGETLLVDSERLLVVDIAGNTLTVRRAYDGTVLAAHSSGATIYAPRRLTVTRGAVGSTAATHSDAAAITRWEPPGLVHELAIAEAVHRLAQEASGYARQTGSGETARDVTAPGLPGLRAQVREAYRLTARTAAV